MAEDFLKDIKGIIGETIQGAKDSVLEVQDEERASGRKKKEMGQLLAVVLAARLQELEGTALVCIERLRRGSQPSDETKRAFENALSNFSQAFKTVLERRSHE